MKKAISVLLVLLLTLCLGVSAAGAIYTSDEFTIDTEKGTIFDGNYTYEYVIHGDSSKYQATFLYPDGSWYAWLQDGSTGMGSQSDDYNPEAYASGSLLHYHIKSVAFLTEEPSDSNSAWRIVLGAILACLGGLLLVFSKKVAQWKVFRKKSTAFAVNTCRISGVVMLGIAIAVFLL